MGTRLFVGSLSWNTTDESLAEFFSQAGTVVSAKVIVDRETGKARGFGFVEMGSEDEAKKAMELAGKMLDGRAIVVNEARPRPTGGDFGNRRPFSRDNDRRGGFKRRDH